MKKAKGNIKTVSLSLIIVMLFTILVGCKPSDGNSTVDNSNNNQSHVSDIEGNGDGENDDVIEELPPEDSHTCVFGDWIIVKEPTNTVDGLRERKCECGRVEQEVIPASNTEYYIQYRNLKSAEYPEETGYNSKDGLLNLPKPEATGYIFIGWYTASIGGDLVDYIPEGSTKNYILYAHWDLISYEITYKNVPNNSNPISYTIESKLKLETPKWSGLAFTHWSDSNGNTYKPEENITSLPENISGDLVLTANWKVLRNIATPADKNYELFNVFSGEEGMLYFYYDLGTIEHIVLDDIDPNLYYKSEGIPINLTLSKTVSLSEETAKSISDTISKSISKTNAWEESSSTVKSKSDNWNAEIGGGINAGIGGGTEAGGSLGVDSTSVSLKKSFEWSVGLHIEGAYNWGGGSTTSEEWSKSQSYSETESETQSHTVNSSLAYKEEITSEITESFTVGAELPSGYYAYVHAGNIRVIGVVSYEIATGRLYLNTYSYLDNMHAMMMYYPTVNELNNPSVEGLDFAIPEDEIFSMIENSYYVDYDANGGTGSMPTTMHSIDGTEKLAKNEYTKEGHIFAGWELTTDEGVSILLDEQSVTNLTGKLQTVTLKALWDEDPSYDKDVVYNATTKTGTVSNSPNITYKAVIEYRNRTADSVEIRIKWTSTIGAYSWTVYGQNFKFSVGAVSSGTVKVASFNAWKAQNQPSRSSTGESGWITVPLSTEGATTIDVSIYYWQTNSNNLDMYKYNGTSCVNKVWTINIPAN